MLYLTVLALEVSGMVFERIGWTRALVVQKAATVPLVIAGAVLSTLHQSSLGSFYLIMPAKLHALWYTPQLPWMFYLSAIAAGLAMMIVESRLSSRAFGRGLEMPLLMSIGRALFVALGVYGSARLLDMAHRGVLGEALAGTREAAFFQLEFALGVILPMALIAWPAVRRNSGRLYGAALMVVAGFVVNRLNVSITGLEGTQGGHYAPAVPEVIITLMLTGIGFAAFGLATKYLPVFPPLERPDLGPVPAAARDAVLRPLPVRT
jgi:Ni/Fe-hydrogenase subunit HybB-like protein